MKKGIIIAGVIIVLGAAGAGGWYYHTHYRQEASDGRTVYVTKVSTLTGENTGAMNRFAGVVEPQETLEVQIESGRKVSEVQVKTGEEVKKGQLLFEYNLTSIQEDLAEAKLDLERLKNEALSLANQITTLEKEKKKASKDNQLSYTIEIETNKMNLKKNEYNQKSKEAEIQKLQNATTNTEVRSEMDGIIQKIDSSKLSSDDGDTLDEGGYSYYGGDSESNAFITILSTGAYRIKGKVNELNAGSIIEGEPVIVRSRVDENQIWRGTMGSIDRDNAITQENNMYGMMDASGDSQTTSSSYPFYVHLDSSEGLMLGQHVYIERDEGQADKKDGLWLSDFYIVDADQEEPYVWAADDKNKLEKRFVILGRHDDELGEYEIVDGLGKKDLIAFPEEGLTEGLNTSDNAMGGSMDSMGIPEDMGTMEDMSGMEDMSSMDMEGLGEEEMPDIIEEPMDDMIEDFSDEELVPIDEAQVFDSQDVEAAG